MFACKYVSGILRTAEKGSALIILLLLYNSCRSNKRYKSGSGSSGLAYSDIGLQFSKRYSFFSDTELDTVCDLMRSYCLLIQSFTLIMC